jgi:hypothetical protein
MRKCSAGTDDLRHRRLHAPLQQTRPEGHRNVQQALCARSSPLALFAAATTALTPSGDAGSIKPHMASSAGDRDLVGLSRQILYDFEMVEALAKRLVDIELQEPQVAWQKRFETTDADVRRSWFETNALLESLLIHARGLTTFLYSSRPTPEAERSRSKRGKAGNRGTPSPRTTSTTSKTGGAPMAEASARGSLPLTRWTTG